MGVELQQRSFASGDELLAFITTSADYLRTSRPTAVNLFEAMNTITTIASTLLEQGAGAGDIISAVVKQVEGMLAKDVADNVATGNHGASAILTAPNCPEKVRALIFVKFVYLYISISISIYV